jgi:PIN domain nuclease of toxin-antitoxin system
MAGSARLGRRAAATISAPTSEIFLSAATAWEIAIKESIRRIGFGIPAAEMVPDAITRYALRPLPVTVEHALSAGALPVHHKDPFDRMLIAQARAEGLSIVTADRIFAAYSVELVDASR